MGTLVGGYSSSASWCYLDMTFHPALVTLQILSGLYLRKCKVHKVDTWRDISWECRCATSWCDLDLTLQEFFSWLFVVLPLYYPLSQVIAKYMDVKNHFYMDDSQLFNHLSPRRCLDSFYQLKTYMNDIHA